MKWLLYFLREESYVTVRKNDVNKAIMLLYEKYCSFIFLSYFTPHHSFQWVKYSSNQKIIWSSVTLILEFYYMSNGLTFEILNIISRNFYWC